MDSSKLPYLILLVCLTFTDASAKHSSMDVTLVQNHEHVLSAAIFTCFYNISDIKAISHLKVEWFRSSREGMDLVWEAKNYPDDPNLGPVNHQLVKIAATGSLPRFPGFYRSHRLIFPDVQPTVAAGYYCNTTVEYQNGRILSGHSVIITIDGADAGAGAGAGAGVRVSIVGPDSVVVRTPLTLTCQVDDGVSTDDMSFMWILKSFQTGRTQQVSKSAVYSKYSVTTKDMGNYTCTVRSPGRAAGTAQHTLIVRRNMLHSARTNLTMGAVGSISYSQSSPVGSSSAKLVDGFAVVTVVVGVLVIALALASVALMVIDKRNMQEQKSDKVLLTAESDVSLDRRNASFWQTIKGRYNNLHEQH